MRKVQSKINTYRLKSRRQIVQHVEGIRKQQHCEALITYYIHATREYRRIYRTKGRPGPDTPYTIVWKNVYALSFAVDADLTIFPAQLTDLQKQVLELLEIPLAAYQ